MAETAVRIAKNIFKKSQTVEDVYMGLLEYRATAVKDLNVSPGQLIQNRRLRTTLPGHTDLFKPKLNINVDQQIKQKQENMCKQYNKNAKDRPDFSVGDTVYMRFDKVWHPGIIKQKWHTPRSYVISTESGEYRRNSSDIRRRVCDEPYVPQHRDEFRTTRSGKRY